jgi:hypothetical protein
LKNSTKIHLLLNFEKRKTVREQKLVKKKAKNKIQALNETPLNQARGRKILEIHLKSSIKLRFQHVV